MLFDLRGRGRRRTIQAIYLGLAILMGGGLILFGVGSGVSGGGLLNGLGGGGSNGAQKQVVSQAEKTALAQTKLHPTDPAGWAALVQARWTSAGQGSNYDSTTGTFTTAGRNELIAATQAWQRYRQLVKQPDQNLAILAARAYAGEGDYANAATTWESEIAVAPGESKGYQCLAANAYAAKQNRKGDLAAAKALSLAPKASRLTLKATLQQVKTNPQIAQTC
jgi:hypothetical protein